MRRLATLFLGLALLSPLSPPAAADQTDERLDALFEELQEVQDPINARGLQNAIWAIWMESDDPEAEAAMTAGIAALDDRNFERALAIYDELVESAPDYAEAWNKRATVHYLLGNYEASLEDIEHTLELEPRHFGAITGRGLIQHAQGNDPAAIDSFERALEIHPHLQSVRQNLRALKARQQPI